MAYLGNGPLQIPVERQISGVNIGTIVQFLIGKSPAGYVKCGEKFNKATYPNLFEYLGSDVVPAVEEDVPIGALVWFPSRNNVGKDFIPADGQSVLRSECPVFTETLLIPAKIPLALEKDWNSNPSVRGRWTSGDGSTNFRMPDLNGVLPDSPGSVFVRGDGKNASDPGIIQGDAIRNIVGGFRTPYSEVYAIIEAPIGAFYGDGRSPEKFMAGDRLSGDYGSPATGRKENTKFDASRVVPTASENRPLNTGGTWAYRMKVTTEFMMKAAATVENEGLVKIAGLIETDSDLQAQIDELSSWPKSGNNENGSWVKHRDGTLICEIPIVEGGTVTGGQAVNYPSKTFPVMFTDPPTIVYGVSSLYPYDLIINSEPGVTAQTFKASLKNIGAANAGGLFIKAMAYGRWK